ncbi:reprolysin family propeptide, partial [Cooperia oncophora]
DFRQSSTNKAFIASIPDGDYEVVHPFQIRDKNERIGIDTRNYFLKAAEHYQHVTIVIRSNAVGRIKLVLERNNFIFLNRTSFRKLDSSGEHGFQQRIENCYYQGTVAGDSSSFVALSSCNGL